MRVMLPVTRPNQVIGLTASSSSAAMLSLVRKSLRNPSRSPSQWPGPRWRPNQAAVTLPPETDEISFTSSVSTCGPSMLAYLVCDISRSTDSARAAAREPPPEKVIRITGRSGLAGVMLRRSGLASPVCNGLFSTWVLAHPPTINRNGSNMNGGKNRARIALALGFAEPDDHRAARRRAADHAIPIRRGIARAGHRDDVIVGLYRQLGLSRAYRVAARDDLADVSPIKSNANIFHDKPPAVAPTLTKMVSERNVALVKLRVADPKYR